MSLKLNNNAVCELVDPEYANLKSNGRFRFRLQPDECYSSDVKIMLGVDKDDNNEVLYNPVLGVLSFVKNIRLLDGATVLEETPINDNMSWTAFKMLNKSNDFNMSAGAYQTKNNLGFTADGFTEWTAGVPDNDSIKVNVWNLPASSGREYNQVGENSEKYQGLIHLRDYFTFLRETPVLSSEVFRNLVVEVQIQPSTWHSLMKKADANTGLTASRPLLIVEKFVGGVKDTLMKGFRRQGQISWRPIEVDTVLYKGSSSAKTNETQTFALKGFNDKYVSRILLANNDASVGVAPMLSKSNNSQGYQVRVNGANVLPNTYKRGFNSLYGQMVDSWGEMNTSMCGYAGDAVDPNVFSFLDANTKTALYENVAYMGLNVNQKIVRFELTLVRNTPATALPQTQMRVFGEVQKVMTIRADGSYNIQYL